MSTILYLQILHSKCMFGITLDKPESRYAHRDFAETNCSFWKNCSGSPWLWHTDRYAKSSRVNSIQDYGITPTFPNV